MRPIRAWELARTLDPLPHRLRLELPPDTDPTVISHLVGGVWAVSRSGPAPLEKPAWRQLGHDLCAALAQGTPVRAALREWSPGAADLFDAWVDLELAVRQLRGAITWPDQPTADAWLRWAHARGGQGRAHHYAQLLLALTAHPRCLWSARVLARRMFERHAEPYDFDSLIGAQLGRQWLTPDASAQDVRGLPLARFLAAWLLLDEGTAVHGATEWLSRAVQAIRDTAAATWTTGLPVQRALWPSRQGFTAHDNGTKAVWVNHLIAARRRSDDAPEASGRPIPGPARTSAALAFALNQTADNFAVRIMPTLGLWPTFWACIDAWMREYPEVLGASWTNDPWLRTWELFDGRGRPWSASRLFLQLSRQLVEENAGEPELAARDPRCEPGRQALCDRLVDLHEQLESSATAERARRREPGLRWEPPGLFAQPLSWTDH